MEIRLVFSLDIAVLLVFSKDNYGGFVERGAEQKARIGYKKNIK